MGTAGVAPRECLLQQPIGDAEIDRVRREVPVGACGTAVTERLHLPNVALRETQLDAGAHERVALGGVAGGPPPPPPPPPAPRGGPPPHQNPPLFWGALKRGRPQKAP